MGKIMFYLSIFERLEKTRSYSAWTSILGQQVGTQQSKHASTHYLIRSRNQHLFSPSFKTSLSICILLDMHKKREQLIFDKHRDAHRLLLCDR
jgi:hypothetical protein